MFLRNRKQGWNFFGTVKIQVQKKTKGGLGGLIKGAIPFFFGKGRHSFRSGIVVGRDTNDELHFKAAMGFWIQDEKAHKSAWSVKGASGNKPCLCCDNVLNCDIDTIINDEYCRHIALALPSEWRLTTNVQFFMGWDLLKRRKPVAGPSEFEKLEIALGIRFDEHALAMDPLARETMGVENTMFDWQHTIVGAGGQGQYELQAFVHTLEDNGYSRAELDEKTVDFHTGNRGMLKLCGNFFRKRVTKKVNGHIKAFASETMAAIEFLCLFVEIMEVVQPRLVFA